MKHKTLVSNDYNPHRDLVIVVVTQTIATLIEYRVSLNNLTNYTITTRHLVRNFAHSLIHEPVAKLSRKVYRFYDVVV